MNQKNKKTRKSKRKEVSIAAARRKMLWCDWCIIHSVGERTSPGIWLASAAPALARTMPRTTGWQEELNRGCVLDFLIAVLNVYIFSGRVPFGDSTGCCCVLRRSIYCFKELRSIVHCATNNPLSQCVAGVSDVTFRRCILVAFLEIQPS